MAIRVIVLDFDGTLVDSNQLKADAYYSLFPAHAQCRRIIQEVLAETFEQSRYVILEEILLRGGLRNKTSLAERVKVLAEHYNDIVLAGAKTCPAKPGAPEALPRLARYCSLYLSSTTPEDALREIVRFRGWDIYFRDVFGYPAKKSETLRMIMLRENAVSNQVLVIGDGESDRASAMEHGCAFIPVRERFPREEIEQLADLPVSARGEPS